MTNERSASAELGLSSVWRAILGLTLVLAASACNGGTAEEEQTTTTASSTTIAAPVTTTTTTPATTTTTEPPIEWDFSPSESPPVVTLIDAGSEPRQVRVYAMSVGTVAETSLQFGLSLVQVIDGVSSGEVNTVVGFELVVEVTDVIPEGFVVTSTYGDYRVSASDRASEASLSLVYGALPGTATRQLVSPSGQIVAVAVDDQLGELGDIASAAAGSAAPLPTEPIGVGAQWEVVSEIEVGGIEFVQTSIITLVEVEGSLLVVEMEIVQELGPEGLAFPGLDPADTDVSLTSIGSGDSIWDLSRPLPISATAEAVQTLHVTVSIAGQETTLDQTVATRFELPSPEAEFGEAVPDQYVSFFELNGGDCLDDTDRPLFGLLAPCAEPHDYEVFAVFTNPDVAGAAHPDEDEVSSSASRRCGAAFFNRVDPELAADLDFAPVAFPLPPFWELGHRTSVCALWSRDLTKLTESQLLAQTRYDTLTDLEFTDQASTVSFPDSTSISEFNLVGSAHQENEALVITTFAEHALRGAPFQQERQQRGAAWFSEPVPVQDGFTTAFVFQLEMYSWFTVGDGFAFVIHNYTSHSLGENVGYNGIGYNRIPNSVAVEFDTVRQGFLGDPGTTIPDAPGLLANHVSVQTNGTEPNGAHIRASLGWANLDPVVMANRAAHVVLIEYVPGEMTIFVDDFETPVLTVAIDLAETLQLDAGSAYVGFTASSGPAITGHKILRWEFASAGPT